MNDIHAAVDRVLARFPRKPAGVDALAAEGALDNIVAALPDLEDANDLALRAVMYIAERDNRITQLEHELQQVRSSADEKTNKLLKHLYMWLPRPSSLADQVYDPRSRPFDHRPEGVAVPSVAQTADASGGTSGTIKFTTAGPDANPPWVPTHHQTRTATELKVDPTVCLKSTVSILSNWAQSPVESFDGLKPALKPHVQLALGACGIREPLLATQKFTIAPIIQGFNSLIQAPYLSGKTTSLLIAVLQRTNLNISKTQALILAPTREQAKHLHQVLKSMTAPTQGNIRTHLCAGGIGGSSALDDIKAARSGPHIVVGTLGRMCDVFASGRGGYNKADVSRVEMVAFDDFGDVVAFPDFSDRVPALIRAMPRGVQLVVTSSTMTPAVLDFTNKFMGSSHVKRIHVPHIDPSNTKIVHSVIRVQEPRHKHMDLIRLLMSCKAKSFDQAIVFTNTSRELEWLADMISSSTNGVWQAATFHRESGPGQRSQVVQNFNSGKVKVLVTSDLLGRGLSDMRQVSLVVHYNVPVAPEDYMRRSTRCTVRCEVDGGAKRCGKGMVVSLVTEEEREMMSIIEMAAGVGIDE